MPYSAKVILDSVQPDGVRLTTMEVSLPKFILAELNTHRMLSKNSASSRAVPFEKMIQKVMDDPVMPVWWGKNQSGMQAKEEMSARDKEASVREWLHARDLAVTVAKRLHAVGAHKQIVNRLIEPWLFTTVIISSTSWTHFFALRCHPDAQPEMRHTAELMRAAYEASTPTKLDYGDWHMPYISDEDRECAAVLQFPLCTKFHANHRPHFVNQLLCKVSAARCARVSYLTHDGKRDLQADIDLHDRLATSGHWSPFEHVAQAQPNTPGPLCGNFQRGWAQYRKTFTNEFTPDKPYTNSDKE